MFGNLAVIFSGGIVILDEVIPHVPLPDDFAAIASRGDDLDEIVDRQCVAAHPGGIPPCGEHLLLGFHFDADQQEIPIREHFDIVMQDLLGFGMDE